MKKRFGYARPGTRPFLSALQSPTLTFGPAAPPTPPGQGPPTLHDSTIAEGGGQSKACPRPSRMCDETTIGRPWLLPQKPKILQPPRPPREPHFTVIAGHFAESLRIFRFSTGSTPGFPHQRGIPSKGVGGNQLPRVRNYRGFQPRSRTPPPRFRGTETRRRHCSPPPRGGGRTPPPRFRGTETQPRRPSAAVDLGPSHTPSPL